MRSNRSKMPDDLEVQRAQQNVKNSTAEFSKAMDHLEDRVENTTHQVQHMKELAARPKQVAQDLVKQSKLVAASYMRQIKSKKSRFISQSKGIPRRVVGQLKDNPRPFAIGLITIASSLGLVAYIQNKRKRDNHTETDRSFQLLDLMD